MGGDRGPWSLDCSALVRFVILRCLLCRGDLFVKYALSRDSPPVWGTAANISGRATALACDKGDQDSLEKALWMAMLAHAVPRRDGLLLPIYNFHLCSVSFCPTEKCLEFTELAVQWTCDAPRRWIRRRRTRAEITWTTLLKVAQELEIDNDQELSVLLAAWASK